MNSTSLTKKNFKSAALIFMLLLFVLSSNFVFSACNKNNFYLKDNNFEVYIEDNGGTLTYMPKDVRIKYGVVFYGGMQAEPEDYAYLGNALARQGYLAVFPKTEENNALANYSETEPAFEKYKGIKFYVAGHDLGGGAAIRRASSNDVKGVILLDPLGFKTQLIDDKGTFVKDEDGNYVWDEFSISNKFLPTLILETDDLLRTAAMKEETLRSVNASTSEVYTLNDSSSAGFVNDAQTSSTQKEETVSQVLDFLKRQAKNY